MLTGYGNFKSALEATRRKQEEGMIGDATILMRDQASTQGTPYRIRTSVNPSWKLGKLYLSPDRIFFTQGHDELFHIPIDKIERVYIEQRKWLGRKVTAQLGIVMKGHKPFYIAVDGPQAWKQTIENLM